MKTKNDVMGYKTGCFYYDPCPLCYGCRNYHVYGHNRCEDRCAASALEKKKKVCITKKLHNEQNFAKMISRPEPVVIGGN